MRRLLLLLAACGDASDPCAGADQACITLTVKGDATRIDHLELDILYGDRHDTITTALADNAAVSLPVVTTITLDIADTVPVGVVAAGKLGGNVLGVGASEKDVAAKQHVEMAITLAPRSTCTLGGDYCGGDELAGNVDTLYRCTDGVPVARGRCTHGCEVRPPPMDDVCLGGPIKCSNGSMYCGGNKVDGDPSSVYGCVNMLPANKMMCPNGCAIEPSPNPDHCR
jgi:hypothetical protein